MRITKAQIFRPAEVLVQVQRLTLSGQVFAFILGQPFLNELVDGIRHSLRLRRKRRC